MVIGTGLFVQAYEPIKSFHLLAASPPRPTLTKLFGLPVWALIGGLLIIAVSGFALGLWCRAHIRRSLTAEQLNENERGGVIGQIKIVSLRTN